MKIKQLGNGGGLDIDQTNSSFLIELATNDYLLFDCGYNIMSALVKLDEDPLDDFKLKYLNKVYISHVHDDHIGNLSTLIYHRYFKLGLITNIMAHNTVYDDLSFIIDNHNSELKSGVSIYATMIETKNDKLSLGSKTNRYFIEAYHPGSNCYGLLVTQQGSKSLYISGDTKALTNIENMVSQIEPDADNIIMYHDFSTWNAPTRNVHACESDISVEYSSDFSSKLIKYHSGEDFDSSWLDLNKTKEF